MEDYDFLVHMLYIRTQYRTQPIILRKILKMDLHKTKGDPALFSSGILNPLSHSFKKNVFFFFLNFEIMAPQILVRLIRNENKLGTIEYY